MKKNVNGIITDMTAEELASHKALTDEGVVRQASRRETLEQRKLDKASGKQKLKDLGLTDDEIKAVTGT
jgi:hypothetical protein